MTQRSRPRRLCARCRKVRLVRGGEWIRDEGASRRERADVRRWHCRECASKARPLLIPLKEVYWKRFVFDGKEWELRPATPRWLNLELPRDVLLSVGYGGARVRGRAVERVTVRTFAQLPAKVKRGARVDGDVLPFDDSAGVVALRIVDVRGAPRS